MLFREIWCSDYCFSFCFKSCLDRKLQAICLGLFSSRLQNQRTGLPLVQLLEVSLSWTKEYSYSPFGFFLVFFCPSSPSAFHWSVEGFSVFPLKPCLRDGMTKVEGEEVIWVYESFGIYEPLEFAGGVAIWFVTKPVQKNQISNDIGPGNAFG